MSQLTTAAILSRTGLSRNTILRWTRAGYITPPRDRHGHQLWSEEDIVRLEAVKGRVRAEKAALCAEARSEAHAAATLMRQRDPTAARRFHMDDARVQNICRDIIAAYPDILDRDGWFLLITFYHRWGATRNMDRLRVMQAPQPGSVRRAVQKLLKKS